MHYDKYLFVFSENGLVLSYDAVWQKRGSSRNYTVNQVNMYDYKCFYFMIPLCLYRYCKYCLKLDIYKVVADL